MGTLSALCDRKAPCLLSLLRIILALMFLCHGGQKLFGYPPGGMGTVSPFSWPAGVSGDLEFVGGCFLLLGLFTRVVAFILSGEMAFAYFMAHAGHGALPINNHGELAVVYCFVFFYMAAAGGGSFSLDRAFRNRPKNDSTVAH